MQKVPGVLGVSGFVDDWAAFCKGLAAFLDLRPIILTFARASGSVINIPKSGVLPTRMITDAETAAVRAAWGDIKILHNTRILGLRIGLHVTIEGQYSVAFDKFTQALTDFGSIRQRLSLAMRVAAANVFFYSLFSFVNRMFYMPHRLLRRV